MFHRNNAVSHLISLLRVCGNRSRRVSGAWLCCLALCILYPLAGKAQERPYFVTYSHDLEEPGNLEVTSRNIAGSPAQANTFIGNTLELEYGTAGWWTTELYVSSQFTQHESALYNGFRLENRFRPLMREHWINPVLYVEFEDINAADKSLLEVVGHDNIEDFRAPNAVSGKEKQREAELKLILSRNWRAWNFAENTIFEKDLNNSPWEFGYALAASRPIGLAARSASCALCAENFALGLEMYGGLGTRYSPGLHDTSQYISPTVQWTAPSGLTFTAGPAIGLNRNTPGILVRFQASYEISQAFHRFKTAWGPERNGERP